MSTKTLVVVPTYNEAGNLPMLSKLLFSLKIPNLELLVVDDDSPDGTAEVAERLADQHPGLIHVLRRSKKEGIGPAYIAGFQQALRMGADIVIQMDADLSHPPEYIPAILDGLKTYDVVVGSRYIHGGGIAGHWGIFRRVLSRAGDVYTRWVLGLHIQDTKSGFKGFRRGVLERISLETVRSKGFIFQAEIVYKCQKINSRILEVPFIFELRAAGNSKMSVSIVVEALWRSLQIRLIGVLLPSKL